MPVRAQFHSTSNVQVRFRHDEIIFRTPAHAVSEPAIATASGMRIVDASASDRAYNDA